VGVLASYNYDELVVTDSLLVAVDTVVCDREFDLMAVFQMLSNLNVNHLIPKRTMQTEATIIEYMEANGKM